MANEGLEQELTRRNAAAAAQTIAQQTARIEEMQQRLEALNREVASVAARLQKAEAYIAEQRIAGIGRGATTR